MKIETSTDEILRLMCNFCKMVTKYRLFKNSVRSGDSIMVEVIYSQIVPALFHLTRHTYYNILLDQIDEYYHRIPYPILQHIRENRFQRLHQGSDRKNIKSSHWEIDALMELINKDVKQLDFPNTLQGWQLHSQNLMLSLRSRILVTNEYSHHFKVDVANAKADSDNYTDIANKGNIRERSTPSKQKNERIMCANILLLADFQKEVNNRKFKKNYFWDTLKDITTTLEEKNEEVNLGEDNHMSHLTNDLLKTTATAVDKDTPTVMLDDAVQGALDDSMAVEDDNNNAEENTDDVEDITIGKKTKIKVKM